MEDAIKREVEVYNARVESERTSQTKADDQAADAVRAAAPEARPQLTEPVS